jgi:hypothetical protein
MAQLRKGQAMPTQVAQWAGIAVTAIVVLGCDTNVFIAVPLGIFAGALATIFVALGERKINTKTLTLKR